MTRIRRRRASVRPEPEQPRVAPAEAWIALLARRAEAGRPGWLPTPETRLSARTRALREGRYNVQDL